MTNTAVLTEMNKGIILLLLFYGFSHSVDDYNLFCKLLLVKTFVQVRAKL